MEILRTGFFFEGADPTMKSCRYKLRHSLSASYEEDGAAVFLEVWSVPGKPKKGQTPEEPIKLYEFILGGYMAVDALRRYCEMVVEHEHLSAAQKQE